MADVIRLADRQPARLKPCSAPTPCCTLASWRRGSRAPLVVQTDARGVTLTLTGVPPIRLSYDQAFELAVELVVAAKRGLKRG